MASQRYEVVALQDRGKVVGYILWEPSTLTGFMAKEAVDYVREHPWMFSGAIGYPKIDLGDSPEDFLKYEGAVVRTYLDLGYEIVGMYLDDVSTDEVKL